MIDVFGKSSLKETSSNSEGILDEIKYSSDALRHQCVGHTFFSGYALTDFNFTVNLFFVVPCLEQ